MIKNFTLLSCCVGILFLLGCAPSEMEKEKQSTRQFSVQEYEAFGKRIAEKVNKRHSDTLNQLFDLEYMLEKMTNQLQKNQYQKITQEIIFKENFKKKVNPSSFIIKELRKGYGRYQFLRFHPRQGVPHLLFRMTSEEGINYHDYEVRIIDNELRLTDLFVFLSGEYLSETLKGTFINLLSQQKQQKIIEPELDEQLGNIQKLKQAIDRHDYEEALQFYNSLSIKTQKSKTFMSYKLLITSNISYEMHQKAIAEYEKLFPDDPSHYLMDIEKYLLQGDAKNILWSVDKLDRTIGGDEYLNLYRGLVYSITEDKEKGLTLVNNYIRNNVKDPDGYWMRFQIHVLLDEPEDAVKTINDINRYTLHSRMFITEKIEKNFPDFAESSHFMNWKEDWIKRHNE
ncbi:tetratricopeptide repeat protein [Xanthocytophaga flava]|uniref:tetratricopeptide repeat protein n=1 Tax=Xanthocytophaga flava TaxID=3048013 RepID=UPI0028D00AE3|nr:hypothetical protein [Xanthocytophaga flavus]MDJ1473028.1 hypothetical protein [Xanthocytophaga flavus]